MDFDYNHIFLENRQISNKASLVWLNILAGVMSIAWFLGLLHISDVYPQSFYVLAPISILLLIIPTFFNSIMDLSNLKKAGKEHINLLTKIILGCLLTAVFLMSICLSHYFMFAWIFPILISCQYYSRKITRFAFDCGLVGMISSYYLSLFFGIRDINLILYDNLPILSIENISTATFYLIPRLVLYCAAFPLCLAITKRTEILMKKQKLSIMACQARQNFDTLQDQYNTVETDSRIKMRFLSKNGINIDAALSAMEDNVEKYNDFVITFVSESRRKKKELASLLGKDTILQYGSKVHALRIKTNALGITSLTDTAFFHEIEAYANNIDIVEANWDKLSAEWDEACDVFTAYIKSIGLSDNTSQKSENHISFKQWGAQLQEAFDALESYDPVKAKAIFNELIQYQIDSEITKNLETIVANIDEILKA